jgi:hypothetical protein
VPQRSYSTAGSPRLSAILCFNFSLYPDKFFKDGTEIEIYYMRSGHQGDGYTTDDEFVPYLFHDGVLVGIGWEVLGGPKTWAGKIVDTD